MALFSLPFCATAWFCSRSTMALSTPGTLRRASVTCCAQCEQVIPVTDSSVMARVLAPPFGKIGVSVVNSGFVCLASLPVGEAMGAR